MIASRRDWQLQQLGITQLALRRPAVLQGKIDIPIPMHVRLVIVAERPIVLEDTLVSDVLRTLRLSSDQVLQLTPDRVAMLPRSSRCNSWQLGVTTKIMLDGSAIASPILEELKKNPDARSKLWRQICEYEHDFLSHD